MSVYDTFDRLGLAMSLLFFCSLVGAGLASSRQPAFSPRRLGHPLWFGACAALILRGVCRLLSEPLDRQPVGRLCLEIGGIVFVLGIMVLRYRATWQRLTDTSNSSHPDRPGA